MEIGTESSTSRVSTLWVRTFTMSTIGLAPVTVIVSSSAPTRSSAFTFAVNPTVSSIPSRTTLAKPGNVNATEYAPGRRAVIWYRPEPSLTPKRLPPGKDGLVASTVTPGSTPPVASVTTPEMAPLSCARTAPGEATNTSKAVSVIRDRLLSVVILCPLPVRIVRGELNYYLNVRVFIARLWPLQYPLFLAVTSLTRPGFFGYLDLDPFTWRNGRVVYVKLCKSTVMAEVDVVLRRRPARGLSSAPSSSPCSGSGDPQASPRGSRHRGRGPIVSSWPQTNRSPVWTVPRSGK